MKLIILTGPQAVGKMAIGMKLAEKTDLRLFHNHMTIELAKDIYGDMTLEAWKLVGKLREDIFDSTAKSELDGLIFTFVWAYNMASDHEYIDGLIKKFENHDAEVYIVELEADLQTRIERNKTALRLELKPSKRDIEWSEIELVKCFDEYRLNSNLGEITHKNYIKINNNKLSPEEVADKIIKKFKLT